MSSEARYDGDGDGVAAAAAAAGDAAAGVDADAMSRPRVTSLFIIDSLSSNGVQERIPCLSAPLQSSVTHSRLV